MSGCLRSNNNDNLAKSSEDNRRERLTVGRYFHQWKDYASEDIINLVEYIRVLTSFFRDIRTEYFNIIVNRDADVMAKRLITNPSYIYIVVSLRINKSFFLL